MTTWRLQPTLRRGRTANRLGTALLLVLLLILVASLLHGLRSLTAS
ncbi:MAG: hypothetical protein NTY38_08320 [Acidobacteria bacterium]|nr:hypothetical protein [Acidobacteriota bacterium]